jgi:hypothetical protein
MLVQWVFRRKLLAAIILLFVMALLGRTGMLLPKASSLDNSRPWEENIEIKRPKYFPPREIRTVSFGPFWWPDPYFSTFGMVELPASSGALGGKTIQFQAYVINPGGNPKYQENVLVTNLSGSTFEYTLEPNVLNINTSSPPYPIDWDEHSLCLGFSALEDVGERGQWEQYGFCIGQYGEVVRFGFIKSENDFSKWLIDRYQMTAKSEFDKFCSGNDKYVNARLYEVLFSKSCHS